MIPAKPSITRTSLHPMTINRILRPNLSMWLSVIIGLPLATLARAQDAKVLGPQSVIEQYDAPVAQGSGEGAVIDFPAMIAAPGADDGVQITPSLQRLMLKIVGTEGTDSGDFVSINGTSRAGKKRDALYAALREKLTVYRDLPATLGDVRFIQQDIADTYREQGFPLMSVVVPPQEIVDGTLSVVINEFSLADYSVMYGDGEGGFTPDAKHWTSDRKLAKELDPLLAEPILSQESLDGKVKFLNNNPYRSTRVVFEPGQSVGESKAVFQIEEKRPWSVQAGYNNHATKASGVNRYSLGGSFGNIPLENHQLSWNATVGDRIDEFENYSLIYTVPNRFGHTFTANVNYSDTANSNIPGITSASTTLQSSIAYDLPLVAGDRFGWNLTTTAFWKQFERESIFGGLTVGAANFDATQLAFSNQFNWKEATATNQIVVTTVFSFAGLTARNSDADFRQFYNTATGEATTQHMVLNYARVQQLQPLLAALDGWSTETQLSWQITNDQLAGSDNFAIGGPSVLRAYQSSEVSGDEGFYGIQFLHLKPLGGDALGVVGRWVDQVRPSLFIEAGEGTFQTGAHESLWDYGVQLGISAKAGLSLNASLAIAGKKTALTDKNEAHFYVSGQIRY